MENDLNRTKKKCCKCYDRLTNEDKLNPNEAKNKCKKVLSYCPSCSDKSICYECWVKMHMRLKTEYK